MKADLNTSHHKSLLTKMEVESKSDSNKKQVKVSTKDPNNKSITTFECDWIFFRLKYIKKNILHINI